MKNIRKHRADADLPEDGRGAMPDLLRLERLLHRAMHPDIPSYDVASVQGAGFDEWCYTDGMGVFMAFTQSVEINLRIALAAATDQGDCPADHAAGLCRDLGDKWAGLRDGSIGPSSKVFFPPGNNLGWLINTDNVLRAFRTDPSWLLKPHPITSDDDVRQAIRSLGHRQVLARELSGMQVLRQAREVGYTTASEMGVIAMILGKPVHDFTLFEYEAWGRLHSIYATIRITGLSTETVMNRLLGCPFSGMVALSSDNETALSRFNAFKLKTLEYREALTRIHHQFWFGTGFSS